jgi:hypothetical protein
VGYYKRIIMVEVLLVGMRKLRAEWNHRLESSWKDVVTRVTSNEGGSRTPNRHSAALSASRVVVFYSEAVVMDNSQHNKLPIALGGGTWRLEVLSSLCRFLSWGTQKSQGLLLPKSFVHPDDAGGRVLWKIGTFLPSYATSHSRRQNSSS